mgnify:CR=1 FL=1
MVKERIQGSTYFVANGLVANYDRKLRDGGTLSSSSRDNHYILNPGEFLTQQGFNHLDLSSIELNHQSSVYIRNYPESPVRVSVPHAKYERPGSFVGTCELNRFITIEGLEPAVNRALEDLGLNLKSPQLLAPTELHPGFL